MEKKNEIKISLSTFLLLLALIIIICMSWIIFKIFNNQKNNTERISELSTKISDLEKNNSHLDENNNTDDGTNIIQKNISIKEEIKVDSEYGKAISEYISSIWVGPEVYEDCMAEFKNIKSAPKDYLAACASFRAMSKVGENIYDAKSKFGDFNDSLVELFGKEANGLIRESDLKKVFFVEKNSDGTYHFSGFDGSELNATNYIISKIEKQDNAFDVIQYEYKIKSDEMALDLEDGQTAQKHIYDRNDKLILNTTIKAIQKGNTLSYKEYDEKGKEIESIEDLLISKYTNKLSVRNIKLEYNISNKSFKMVSNELKK